jgi:hypothetical protein
MNFLLATSRIARSVLALSPFRQCYVEPGRERRWGPSGDRSSSKCLRTRSSPACCVLPSRGMGGGLLSILSSHTIVCGSLERGQAKEEAPSWSMTQRHSLESRFGHQASIYFDIFGSVLSTHNHAQRLVARGRRLVARRGLVVRPLVTTRVMRSANGFRRVPFAVGVELTAAPNGEYVLVAWKAEGRRTVLRNRGHCVSCSSPRRDFHSCWHCS